MRSNYDKLRMYFSRNQQIYVFENILTSHNGILLIKEQFNLPPVFIKECNVFSFKIEVVCVICEALLSTKIR